MTVLSLFHYRKRSRRGLICVDTVVDDLSKKTCLRKFRDHSFDMIDIREPCECCVNPILKSNRRVLATQIIRLLKPKGKFRTYHHCHCPKHSKYPSESLRKLVRRLRRN